MSHTPMNRFRSVAFSPGVLVALAILVGLLVVQPVQSGLTVSPVPDPFLAGTSPGNGRSSHPEALPSTDPYGLALGDTVKVLASALNCRATPSPNGTLISTESSGQLGTIDNGSVSSGGYIWWYIAYTDGHTGWSAEGNGTTAWLQNVTGQNTTSVAYNRTAAMYYAAHYWNVVTSDGYFWNGPSTYVSLAQGTNVTNMSGDDCAHFVSQVIGDEPHQPGGGLNIPSRVPPTYGEPGNAALGDLVINNGWGVVVPSVTDLLPGDIINYQWLSTDATWDHVAVYLGNGTVAAHTNSHYGANWTLGGAYAYRFIHILNGTVGGSVSVSAFTAAPASVQLGGTTYLNVTASGGTAPLTYAFTGLPAGCTSANTLSLTCTPTVAGQFNVTVTVSDAAGSTASRTTALTVVAPTPTTLQSVTIAPASWTIAPGGAVPLTATPTCSPGACPAGVQYIWSASPALGTFSPTTGPSVTFRAGNVTGTASVTVNASLNGTAKSSSPSTVVISHAPSVLSSVSVTPPNTVVPVGVTVSFQSTAVCTPGTCLPTATYRWSLSNPSLGTLTTPSSPSVGFTAGNTPGNGTVSVTVIYNGTTLTALANLTVTPASGNSNPLTSVRITPADVSVKEGSRITFSALPSCTQSPCPTGIVYSWSLNDSLGTLSASIGQNSTFTSGSQPGTALVTITASWNGKTVNASTTVTVTQSSTSPGTTGILNDGATSWILVGAAVLIAGMVTVAVVLRRRRQMPPPE